MDAPSKMLPESDSPEEEGNVTAALMVHLPSGTVALIALEDIHPYACELVGTGIFVLTVVESFLPGKKSAKPDSLTVLRYTLVWLAGTVVFGELERFHACWYMLDFAGVRYSVPTLDPPSAMEAWGDPA
ncbi:MAG: hypothetical protein KHF84_03480 [Thermoplasmata archaeon]|nr:hypothetical protein [Candidatus Sysuiplasma jiujiangense]